MAMNMDKNITPPESDTGERRVTPIVPGDGMSSSCKGLSPALPSGAGDEHITEVETDLTVAGETAEEGAVLVQTRGEDEALSLAQKILDTDYLVRPSSPSRDPMMASEGRDLLSFTPIRSVPLCAEDAHMDDNTGEPSDVPRDRGPIISLSDEELPPSIDLTCARSSSKRRRTSFPSTSPSSQEFLRSTSNASFRLLKRPKPSRIRPRDPPVSADSLDGTRMELIPAEELECMEIKDLANLTSIFLEKMETIRCDSKGFQGPLSGSLKCGFLNMSEIFGILFGRLSRQAGDDSALRAQNVELAAQLRALKRDELVSRKEQSSLRRENAELKRELEALRARVSKLESLETAVRPSVAEPFLFGGKQPEKNSEFRFEHRSSISDRELPARGDLPDREQPPLPRRIKVIENRYFIGKYNVIKRPNAVAVGKTPSVRVNSGRTALGNDGRSATVTSDSEGLGESTEGVFSRPGFPPLPKNTRRLQTDLSEVYTSESGDSRVERRTARRSGRDGVSPASCGVGTSSNGVVDNELDRIKSYMDLLAERRRELRKGAAISSVQPPAPDDRDRGSLRRNKNPVSFSADKPVRGPRRRPPRSAAVTITSTDANVSYADLLKKARGRIELKSLGIEDSRIRRGINGRLIIEIPGENGAAKADDLSRRLKEVIEGPGVRVNRPTSMGELRIWNFDESISTADTNWTPSISWDMMTRSSAATGRILN